MSLNVIITGISAPRTKGTIFSFNKNPEIWKIQIFGTNITEDSTGKYFVSHFFQVPLPEDPKYIDVIL